MTDDEYIKAREEITARLGKALKGNGFEEEPNQAWHELQQLKGKHLADKRKEAKDKRLAAQPPEIERIAKLEPKQLETVFDKLSGFVPLESDLKEFREEERDILRVYLGNPSIEHKNLANKFGKSYQWISGFLNSKPVLYLESKYWKKHMDRNTRLGLLKLTKDADSKIVLAAAEWLNVLNQQEAENASKAIDDPVAEERLKQLGDELADK